MLWIVAVRGAQSKRPLSGLLQYDRYLNAEIRRRPTAIGLMTNPREYVCHGLSIYVVRVAGIEPALVSERDYEYRAVCQFHHARAPLALPS